MPRSFAPLAWPAFLAVTAVLLVGLLQQPVDPSNSALKVPGSADDQRLRALAQIVGDAPTVLLAFATLDGATITDEQRAAIDRCGPRIAALPAVVEVGAGVQPAADLRLLPVELAAGDALAHARAVQALARAEVPPAMRLRCAGLPLVEGTIAALVAAERTRIVPLLLAVLWIAVLLCYRRVSLATAVLLPPVAAIAWIGGSIAWAGHALDPVAALLDPVLLTIGVAASVHFVAAFRRALHATRDVSLALTHARLELRRPACFAAVTTMLGLWSLTTNETPAVLDFGVRAAAGVALTHAFTFLLLPPWLRRFGGRADGASFARLTAAPRRAGWLWFATATSVAAAFGLGDLRMDNDPASLLPASDPVAQDLAALNDRLGGVELVWLTVPPDSPAAAAELLLPFLARCTESPVFAGLGGPARRAADGALAVPMVLAPGGSDARNRAFEQVERTARSFGLGELALAGEPVRIARDSERLMQGLVESLLLSLVVLTLAMAAALRSLRLAGVAMVPNLLPSLWLYGALGWLRHPVSVATAMIGCTMLGLIVDNTLHLLHHYRSARREGLHAGHALERALDRCRGPIRLSSVVLMLGFATAATSRLSTTVEFAALATSTIALAWFGTAIVLPAMLSLAPNGREPRVA